MGYVVAFGIGVAVGGIVGSVLWEQWTLYQIWRDS
jgi:hypothetical protein